MTEAGRGDVSRVPVRSISEWILTVCKAFIEAVPQKWQKHVYLLSIRASEVLLSMI
jgi:hypothetical protein